MRAATKHVTRLTICAALFFTIAGTAPSMPADTDAGAVADHVAKKWGTLVSPGLAIAVVRDGKLEVARGYGMANLARDVPVSPDTRFEIGSITKQFTAACVLQLARARKLSLDDKLGKYVPEYERGRDVTLRELLGQTSGIPEYLDGAGIVTDAARPTTFDALLALVSSKPLLFKPGTHWAYSNTNYVLLGRVIAVASGEPYESYVREHIFEPAGMTHSGFIGDGMAANDTALGYDFLENTTEKRLLGVAPRLDESWVGAAGGVVSTLGDMAGWDGALESGRILSAQDVATLRTAGKLPDGTSTQYGFGWIVDDIEGHRRLWHNGGTFGFHAVNDIFPDDGLAIIVFANEAGAPVEDIATNVFLDLTPDAAERRSMADLEEDPDVTSRVRDWIAQMQSGELDRAQLTPALNKAITTAALSSDTEQYNAFGKLERLVFKESRYAQGATAYSYLAGFTSTSLALTMTIDPDGLIARFSYSPS